MKNKGNNTDDKDIEVRPALTPEGWEARCCGLAYSLAEQQLRDGTASSQIITHFLKMGSTREKLEQEHLVKDIELTDAKRDKIFSDRNNEEIYQKALDAMKLYQGVESDTEEDMVVIVDDKVL